jgi:polyribonucleotide nucleotidyltransferase
VQLDTKLPGVDLHLLEAALAPAAAARARILSAMEGAVKAFESSKFCRHSECT